MIHIKHVMQVLKVFFWTWNVCILMLMFDDSRQDKNLGRLNVLLTNMTLYDVLDLHYHEEVICDQI